MHEFSIATNVVQIATEHAHSAGAEEVRAITLRIGALTCVHKQAIEFCFEIVARETPLEGAELKIIEVPATIFCAPCDREVELPGLQRFCCPICDTPSAEVRQGRELEIESIEILSAASWPG